MGIIIARTSMPHRLQTLTFDSEINFLEIIGYYQPNPKTLGEYIRKTRLDRKMTAMELPELVGCSKNILLDWEMDREIPVIRYLKRHAQCPAIVKKAISLNW